MNAYSDGAVTKNLQGNPVHIWFVGSVNSAGLHSGTSSIQLHGKRLSDGSDFDHAPVWGNPHPQDDDYPLSKSLSTSDAEFEDDDGNILQFDANYDCHVYSYVDGTDQFGTPQGRKHQIDWIANENRFSCFIETRVNGQWQRHSVCYPPDN